MKTITLKNQNETIDISQLAIGHLGYHLEERREGNFTLMNEYIARGGNTFDNARIYGDGQSERWLGEFFRQNGKRQDCIITSKCGHHNMKTRAPRMTADCFNADINTTPTHLKSDYVDILFLHRDDIFRPVDEIMVALHEIVKSGKARMLGASNWTAGRIAEANEFAVRNGLTPFSVSQICCSLALSTPAVSGDVTHVFLSDAEKAWYKETGLPLMAWSPSARGFFSQAIAGKVKPVPNMWYGWCKENFERAKRAEKIANAKNCPLGSVVLAYLHNQPLDISSVISFSSEKQFEEAFKSLEIKLTPKELHFLTCGK